MKIYKLESYSIQNDTFDDEKLLSITYHSSQSSIKKQMELNGTEDSDFCPINHQVKELYINGKKDVIKALNDLGETYRIY
tara:strand:- start:279 stop:518 length:240 start_codon:yes stop_codon:yes gene_type:complete